MDFFGYSRSPDATSDVPDLRRHGDHAAAGCVAVTTDATGSAGVAWCHDHSQRDGVLVACRGQPWFAADGGKRAWQGFERPADRLLDDYLRLGDGLLERLGGRFALAIIDTRRQRTLLAVDPMGIDRIAFAHDHGTLVFGTSAEAVARTPGRTVRLDPDALFDYLVLHMVPSPGTIFRGVRKLRPGWCATIERGVLTERRYWNQRFTDARLPFESLRQQLHDDLREAVRACQPGSESGAFLSGGLDSSTVAGLLSEVGAGPARTFTIGFGHPDYDETEFSRAANARFGCDAHEYIVRGEDIADGFAKIARAYDEPFGNSSALPVYYCAKLAHDSGVSHLLAGDGGDELFAGNSRYAEQEVFERYRRLPGFIRRGMIEPVLGLWPRRLDFWLTRKGRGYVEKANVPLPARLETWNFLLRQGTATVLHPDFRSAIDEGGIFRRMQELWDATPGGDTLSHMLYYDWQHTLADNDLRKVETMSALAGVRVSYPMLHPQVVELAMRIPSSTLMPGAQLRDFYKRAMTGWLPDLIIHKKKHGFGLPFGLWLQETPRLRQQIDDNLSAFRSRGVVQPELVERLRHLHGQDDARYYGVFIWVLAMLEQWLQEHGVSP